MIVAVCIFTGSYNHLRLSLAEAGLFLLELILWHRNGQKHFTTVKLGRSNAPVQPRRGLIWWEYNIEVTNG